MHASRNLESVGQGAFRFFQSQMPLMHKRKPAKTKTINLFSEIQISPGTWLASPANTTPRPMLTSSAGSAQHKSVLMDIKSIRKFEKRFILLFRFLKRRNQPLK
jgi:hypothetical protein